MQYPRVHQDLLFVSGTPRAGARAFRHLWSAYDSANPARRATRTRTRRHDGKGREDGGGTAALRTKTWPIAESPCAVGIPTGWSQETGGFISLLPIVKTLIDLSMMESSQVNPPVRVPPRRMQTEPNRLSEESQAELARLTKTN